MTVWLALAVALGIQAQTPVKMITYQLVMLKKGPTPFTQDEPTRRIVEQHNEYLKKLGADGTGLAAGPFTDGGEIGSVIVMNAATPEKAREIEAADPAVKAGLFVMEVLPFMAPEGWFGKWMDPFAQETVYFGFLNRGPNRTQDPAGAAQLQKEHLAYMDAQGQQGKLVLAGPFVDGGVHRGVVVYRVATMEEAKRRAEGDPMIKAGRLVVELHPWQVPRGALP
ncbi:MAG: YciI family protein [Acidobacteria bacterium]|nr:YciI family protein [Acidobacteriota bacterium]MCA1652541.1 YciI family protein [Acidobacteriota bacterium]